MKKSTGFKLINSAKKMKQEMPIKEKKTVIRMEIKNGIIMNCRKIIPQDKTMPKVFKEPPCQLVLLVQQTILSRNRCKKLILNCKIRFSVILIKKTLLIRQESIAHINSVMITTVLTKMQVRHRECII